jgi:hypothetical protein
MQFRQWATRRGRRKAQREYDDFAPRRRTHRELLAETEAMREIEAFSKPAK